MNFDLETLLKAPFPVDSLSWRIGNKSNWDRMNNKPKDSNKPVKAQMLVYIDSRDVQDRLDEVCRLCDSCWENDFKEVCGRLVCKLTVGGLTRSDGAGDTDFEAEKGGLSDALKRAAVLFGVGRYLYNAKNFNTWVKYEKKENGEMETDFDMPKKAKEELADVARQLGESVKTYHYWLNLIDSTETQEEFETVRQIAGKYAKREDWSAGNIETFKKHIEDKKKGFEKEKEDGIKE